MTHSHSGEKTISIIDEAANIVRKQRSENYGHPLDNHRRIAAIWNVQLERKLKAPIEPRDVALLMIGLKLAREVHTSKRDNLVDVVGYADCVEQIDRSAAAQASTSGPCPDSRQP